MDVNKEYVLTGGYFLYQILEAMNDQAKRRGVNNGGITQSNCFKEMIRLGNPDEKLFVEDKTATEDTSKYKKCKLEPAAWMLFDGDSYIKSINNFITNDYEKILHRTILWGDKFLNLPRFADWLGKAILEIFYADKSIDPNSTYLYALRDGSKISLTQLFQEEVVYIQPLILGAWHYIVNAKRPNDFRPGSKNSKAGITHLEIENAGKNHTFNCRIKILDPPKSKSLEGATRPELFGKPAKMIAPVITEVKPSRLTIAGERLALSDDEFADYLRKIYEAYKEVKTLLFRREPREFDKIYLPNDIIAPAFTRLNSSQAIKDPDIEKIGRWTNFIIISGTGGLGKSMMMRHLLLDAVEKYKEYKYLPVFIALKDYNSSKYDNLLDYIYEEVSSFEPKILKEKLEDVMASGRCLLLLDGLDEIKNAERKEFEKKLEKLTNGFGDSIFVISSRPFTHYISFGRFTKMNLAPFSKEQSVKLIEKLDMGPDMNPLKDKFQIDLEKSLYDEHREFAENPLLLTIMLMTYKNHSNIPVKMHKFYSKAYDTLFAEHDAIKPGGYVREYKTGLTQERFEEYVDEFCFLSYQDENFDITDEDCKQYFLQLESVEEDNPSFTWKDFMDDLTYAVCLMYEEGGKYHFLHRSFQEYFCARYFYRQEEGNLWDIAMFFDEMHTRANDKTFPMLYDMKPTAIEESVFLPMLSQIFSSEQRLGMKLKPSYSDFVQKVYPKIAFDEGDVPEMSVTSPKSYIYSFMARDVNKLPEIDNLETEWQGCLTVIDEYVYYDPNFKENCDEYGMHYEKGDNEKLMSREEVSDEYLDHFFEPEVVGSTYELDTRELYRNEPENIMMIDIIEDEGFPIRQEFEQMYAYYQELLHYRTTQKKDLRTKLRKKHLRELYVSSELPKEEAKKLESNHGNAVRIGAGARIDEMIAENKGRIFELASEYCFCSSFGENGKRCIEVVCNIDGVTLTGKTSMENWISESYMNNVVSAGKYECTAWFSVISLGADGYHVQFLILGGEIIW